MLLFKKSTAVLPFFFFIGLQAAFGQSFSIKPNGTHYICYGDSVKVTAINGFSNYSWSTGQKGQSVTLYKPGRYVGYGYMGRTRFSDTIEIKHYPRKTLSLYPNPKTKQICQGDSIIIEASSGFKVYEWTDKKRGQRVVYKPKSSMSILCTAVDSNGCVYKEDMRVTVINCSGCPKILSGDPHLCEKGDSVILEAKSGYSNYAWVGGPKGRLYTVKKAGWYYIEFTNGTTKCKDSIYVSEGKLNFSITSIPSPPVICKGDSIKLIAPYKGFKSFWWSTGHRYNDFWFTPQKSQKVVVEAKDNNGCEYRATIEITVKDTCNKDSCDVLGAWPRNVLCSDKDSVILEAKSGFKKYLWNDKGDGRLRTVKKAGWYWVEVINQAGDTCRDSVYIRKAKAKELKLGSSPNPPVICPGQKVVLEATGGFKEYWWNTGHKNTNRIVLENIRSTKGVVVEAVDSNGCPARAVLYITVKDTCGDSCDILEAWPRKVICGDKDSVILEAKYGYKKYLWHDKGDGRLRTAKKEGWYWVEVINQAGDTCRDSIYIEKVKPQVLKLTSYPNPPVICPGDRVALAATPGFKKYWWNTGHKDTAAIVLTGIERTKGIVVEATDKYGCPARAVLYITVKDTCKKNCDVITAWPKKVLCGAYDSVILEARSGYTKYMWQDKDGGQKRIVKKEGWYWVEVINTKGDTCRDSMYIAKVKPKELKLFSNPNPAKVCKGKKLVIEATSGFVGYWWSTRDTGDRIEIYPTKSGKVVVEALDSNGCVARKELSYIVDTCTGSYARFDNQTFKLYPNPNVGTFTMEFEKGIPGQVKVYSLEGQLVYTQAVSSTKEIIHLPELSGLFYVVVYENREGTGREVIINSRFE